MVWKTPLESVFNVSEAPFPNTCTVSSTSGRGPLWPPAVTGPPAISMMPETGTLGLWLHAATANARQAVIARTRFLPLYDSEMAPRVPHESVDNSDHVSFLNHAAFLHVDRRDRSVHRSLDRDLHLHRPEDYQRVPARHRSAGRHQHLPHVRDHLRFDVCRHLSPAPASSSSRALRRR